MKKICALLRSFTMFERLLWLLSTGFILGAFLLFPGDSCLTLVASLIGAAFLILNAKGYVLGLFLTVLFSILYAILSYDSAYYGEMVTYLGMTTPISIASIVTWIRNPAGTDSHEVKVNTLTGKEYLLLGVLSVIVTVMFYFILKAFHTASLLFSTLSVFTSFVASYLTMRRSEYYAIGYAANDAVLIVLWSIATVADRQYVAMIVCFVVFLVNDLYGFYNWLRMKKRQNQSRHENICG